MARLNTDLTEPLVAAAALLRDSVERLRFARPVTHVYNPLQYAWPLHEAYLRQYGRGRKRVLFLGMNPGPWGMAQTGVPFGEVAAVRDWLKLDRPLSSPRRQTHPARPIEGLACVRSEVSGRRLWGLFQARFGTPTAFFRDHFVANYCPLVFLESTGRNFTPDKLPVAERARLQRCCDLHLEAVLHTLQARFVVGVGKFAQRQLDRVVGNMPQRAATLLPQVVGVLHPSPASPAANRDWAGQAAAQLTASGVWPGNEA